MIDQARMGPDPLPRLAGIPIGLKDLYAVAGKPLTASSRLLDDRAVRTTASSGAPCAARGMILARPPAHARVRRRRHDRPGRQPVGARPLGRRLERRLGRRARRAHGAGRHRHGHGGVAAHPLGALRHLHDQADARARLAARRRAPRDEPRPRRPDGAHARGLRAAPRGDAGDRLGRPASCSRPPAGLPGPRGGAAARRRRAWRSPRASATGSTPTSPTASTRRSRTAGARRRAARAAPAAGRRSRSGTTSSTSSAPSCSPTTGASTGAAIATGPRCASGSSGAEARDVPAERYVAAQARRARAHRGAHAWLVEHRISALIEPTVPVRRPAARRRLRPRRQRLRPDLAHALLGLDGLPGRRAAGRHRLAQRAARRRLADRARRHRLASARHRHPAAGGLGVPVPA